MSSSLSFIPATAPNKAVGTDNTTDTGNDQLSYCAERIRNTKIKEKDNNGLGNGEHILFVDDEATNTYMVGQMIRSLGYSVTVQTSSLVALELFRSKPADFDVVITDMTMPNMTGDNLARELIKIRANIPIILCTGYSEKISDETASKIGIRAFAYKPILKADLAKMLKKVLSDCK